MTFFYIENIFAAIVFALLAYLFGSASEARCTFLERLTRNRWAGVIAGLPALIMCVPHAAVVAPSFLLPFLLPLAVIIPILCFFFIDYYTARALGGIIIIYAYDVIHYAFELKLPGAAAVTVAAWLFGFAGIWMSGKPCALRDWFRLACRRRDAALLFALLSAIPALAALWMLVAA